MDKKQDFIFQSKLFAGAALFILAYSLGQYYSPYYILGNYIQNGLLMFLLLFFLCTLGDAWKNQRIHLNNLSVISLVALTVAGAISCAVNDRKDVTIYGDEFQGMGLLSLIALYVIFIAVSQIRNQNFRKALFHFFLLFLVFVCAYGILQYYQVPLLRSWKVRQGAILPTKNENAFSVFPCICNGLILGRLLYGEKLNAKKQLKWYGMAFISFWGAFCTHSAMIYVAFIMMTLLAVFLEIVSKRFQFRPIVFFVLVFIAVYFLFDILSGGVATRELFMTTKELQEEGSVLGDSVGNGRMQMWKEAFSQMKGFHWLWGNGIERFAVHFVNPAGMEIDSYDAHNEYLTYWYEQGLFALISYLIFLFSLFIPGVLQFIKKDRYESDFVAKAAFLAFFGYIAQAFFNIFVIQSAPYFWPVCGLMFLPRIRKKTDDVQRKESSNDVNEETVSEENEITE